MLRIDSNFRVSWWVHLRFYFYAPPPANNLVILLQSFAADKMTHSLEGGNRRVARISRGQPLPSQQAEVFYAGTALVNRGLA
jgi:hypothetical protein